MIGPAYLQRMARYNRWQNESLYGAADGLPDDARRKDRGAFHGSITETLNHILWADRLWMSRFSPDWSRPEGGIAQSRTLIGDWTNLRAARADADARLIAWADEATEADIDGDLSWYSGAMGKHLTRPKWVCMVQLFNHQTHHRGQVHAMLTQAGAKPDDTDVPFMPETYL